MNKQQPICLVIPPSPFLLDQRVFLTLGILRVAACLERDGHKVEVLDLSGIENFQDAVADYIAATTASLVGITATTPQMPATMRVVETIRKHKLDAKVLLGGPHVTLVNAALKKERKVGFHGRATTAFALLLETFDILLCGDGEDAIFAALQPDAPKVIDVDDPKSSMFLTNERLNELPWPARHLVDVSSYHYSIESLPATSLVAQNGCPMACNFCGGRESPMLRRIRMRSSQNVVNEILHLHDTYGFTGFNFFDDELNINRQMVELMDMIAQAQHVRGKEFRLRGFIKAELFTEEHAVALYRAGFRWILVGFESGSERILVNINKKASRQDNTDCLNLARKHGLKVKALMSIGHPGESEETVAETRDWLLEVKPDDFDCSIISCYPGTGYYDWARQLHDDKSIWTFTHTKTQDRLHSYEVDFTKVSDFYKGRLGEYVSYVFTDHLTADRFPALRDGLENEVREKLKIPFNPSAASIQYEHSMGMGKLPPFILKSSQ